MSILAWLYGEDIAVVMVNVVRILIWLYSEYGARRVMNLWCDGRCNNVVVW